MLPARRSYKCHSRASRAPNWRSNISCPICRKPSKSLRKAPRSHFRQDFVCLGDIYAAGTALVQVSQPRQPCSKLAFKHQLPDLPKAVCQTGKSGFYFRVLKEGVVAPGAPLVLVERGAGALSIAYINHIYYHERDNAAAIKQIASHPALSASWREAFQKRLSERTRP
nr:MOSC domain-containing protein [Geobacillus sp. MAS1]